VASFGTFATYRRHLRRPVIRRLIREIRSWSNYLFRRLHDAGLIGGFASASVTEFGLPSPTAVDMGGGALVALCRHTTFERRVASTPVRRSRSWEGNQLFNHPVAAEQSSAAGPPL